MEQKKLTGYQQTYLDVFRIVAALLVLIGHIFSWYGITVFKNEHYYPYLQNIGVIMLFLLSGFLTAYSIEKKNIEHSYTFHTFAIYKYLRILREYFPALILIMIIDKISMMCNSEAYSFYSAYTPFQFLGNLLMFQGTAVNSIPGIDIIPFGSARPLWTLSIEWWFYLLFAYIYLVISNKIKIHTKKVILLVVLLIMPLEYFIGGRGNGLGLVFCLGIVGYYIYNNIDIKVSPYLFALFCMAYIIYGLVCKDAYTTLSYIIMCILFSSGLKMCEYNTKKQNRNIILRFISQSTFMLYMLHYSIINVIWTMKLNLGIFTKCILSFIVSIAVSAICFYVFGTKDWIKVIRTKLKKNNTI